jgi:hypothetical protein
LLAMIALCQQHVHGVGKEFSFFQILNSNLFGSLATLFTSTWLNVGPFCNI